jgi:leucyl aminopeptidase
MAAAIAAFDPTPSLRRTVAVRTQPQPVTSAEADALAVPLGPATKPPVELDTDWAALESCGFDGLPGQALVLPHAGGPVSVLVGTGTVDQVTTTVVRDLAADFARAVPQHHRLAVRLPEESGLPADAFAQAVVEGVLGARWRFSVAAGGDVPTLDSLVVVAPEAARADVEEGIRRGTVVARATGLGRDLANCPAATLTAVRMAEVAADVGAAAGLNVQVFDEDELVELGCGGLLGVNLGSVEPARMVRLRYLPERPTAHLTLVGKGVMYDSGGISLKPSDASHSTMKNDMSGAAAVLAAMTALRDLGCRIAVTGYLMCTDNMPSGSALKLGDVLTIRGGTTVEVLNTDAEGRLVMADALVLATEEPTDAIVDVATLTGQCLRTFGTEIAAVLGNDQALVDQVVAAGEHTDEPVWQLPLARRYRNQLDSTIADLTNMGGINAGSITAALFLEEFVGGQPWAHIDIAGTAQADFPRTWRPAGATGFGTPLLIDLATHFLPSRHVAVDP